MKYFKKHLKRFNMILFVLLCLCFYREIQLVIKYIVLILTLLTEAFLHSPSFSAPEAPAPRLGPHPPQIQPSFPPQLTTIMNATPNGRENASFPSRSHHGTSNTAAGSLNTGKFIV